MCIILIVMSVLSPSLSKPRKKWPLYFMPLSYLHEKLLNKTLLLQYCIDEKNADELLNVSFGHIVVHFSIPSVRGASCHTFCRSVRHIQEIAPCMYH
jgi:hypothetical protein